MTLVIDNHRLLSPIRLLYDVGDNASLIDDDDNCAVKDLFWSLQIHSPFTGTCSVVVKRGWGLSLSFS